MNLQQKETQKQKKKNQRQQQQLCMNGGGKKRLFYILGDRRDAHLKGVLIRGGGGANSRIYGSLIVKELKWGHFSARDRIDNLSIVFTLLVNDLSLRFGWKRLELLEQLPHPRPGADDHVYKFKDRGV